MIKQRPFSVEKFIDFNQVQNYLQENPTTKIFFIYGLNGIWGYKDGKFIKILFKKKEYKEMDGDLYFKKYLYPQSPNGIRRIIEGENFIITIVGT
ncbi:hypothetical protein [Parabacteroides pacaensis]|uniref:hypothetical protein n=1 Tax=Parabacteroides pacaensis TaxID=2086575 RepID=UPI000D0E8A5F|nr:hypothetical protein [Parabacteroides pacaensis]